MVGSLLAAANWPIVGQICWVLGKVMNFIYHALDKIAPSDTGLVGWSIIIYTIVVYMLMLPITIKQQQTSRMTSIMNPEIQAIQKKYRNRRDQASQMKMQEEMQYVYDKYGTSMYASCLPLAIQMPLLFALYPVIYNISNYVDGITDNANKFLFLPNLSESPWHMIQAVRSGEDLGVAGGLVIATCILLPIISGLTQYLNIKISQSITGTGNTNDDNPMAQSMKSMNITMPLFSVWMVFSLASGIGLYWVISAIVRTVQTVLINRSLQKVSPEDLVAKNKDKADKKKAKRNAKNAARIAAMSQVNTKQSGKGVSSMSQKEKDEQLARARQNVKPGSLADKANMVNRYNNQNKK